MTKDSDIKINSVVKELPEFIDTENKQHNAHLFFLIILFRGIADKLMGHEFADFKKTHLSKIPQETVGQFTHLILIYKETLDQKMSIKIPYQNLLSFLIDPNQNPIYQFLYLHKQRILQFMKIYSKNQEKIIILIKNTIPLLSSPYLCPKELKKFCKRLTEKTVTTFFTVNFQLETVGKEKDFYNKKMLTEHWAEILSEVPTTDLVISKLWKKICLQLGKHYLYADNQYYFLSNLQANSLIFRFYSNLMSDAEDWHTLCDSEIEEFWQAVLRDRASFPKLLEHKNFKLEKLESLTLTKQSFSTIIKKMPTKYQMSVLLSEHVIKNLSIFLAYDGVPMAIVLWKAHKFITLCNGLWLEYLKDDRSDDDLLHDNSDESSDDTPSEEKSSPLPTPNSSPRLIKSPSTDGHHGPNSSSNSNKTAPSLS